MATVYIYRHNGTNQVVYLEAPEFAGNPNWTLVNSGGAGGGVSPQELTTHEQDTTNVHGIANTSDLATQNFVIQQTNAVATAAIPITQKGASNGVATLDSTGKIPAGQISRVELATWLGESDDQAEMLAKTGTPGDFTIRTDTDTLWVLVENPPSQLANWLELEYTPNGVTSVAGRTGAVTLAASDITSGTFPVARLPLGTDGSSVVVGNDARFAAAAQRSANLSDLGSAATARTNLGLGSVATRNVGTTAGTAAAGDDARITGAAQTASNLGDLASSSTARTNLGLGPAALLAVGTTTGTVAAGDDTRITGAAQKASNLSDLASASTARTNLGLGTSATRNVGTTAGTVAAGDDPRFSSGGEAGSNLVINVKASPYNAVGDGSTNDTSAINAAIAAASAAGGGTVFFPASSGPYMHDGDLNIPSYVHLVGSEPAGRYWVYNPTDMPPSPCAIKLRPGSSASALIAIGASSTAWSIRDISLLGGQVGTGIDGISFATPAQEHNSIVANVAIIGFSGDGIRGRLFATRWHDIFVGSNKGYGLNCDGTNSWTDSWFVGAIVTGNVLGGVNFASTAHCGEVNFTDCRFERSGWDPAHTTTPTATASPGIRITGTLIGASFTGCSTDANSGNGVEITRADGTVNMHHILFTSCRFNRDGFGTMAGVSAPERAAVRIGGASGARIGFISFVNCLTTEGKADEGGGLPGYTHAKYGLWWTNVDYCTWIGGDVSAGHSGGRLNWTSVWRPAVTIAAPAGTLTLPVWTTSTRPTPILGTVGYNEETGLVEFSNGSTWANIDAGGGGGGGVSLAQLNAKTVVTVSHTAGSDYVCDGTADQVEIQQAIDAVLAAGGGTVFIKGPTTYNCTAGLNVDGPVDGLTLAGDGMGITKLVFTQTTDDPGLQIGRGNTIASDILLTVNTVLGSRTLTLANASTISVGDWLLLKSNKVADTESASKFVGEMLQVTAKSGNIISVHDVVKDTYTTADSAAVAKVVMPSNITIRDMSLSLPLDRQPASSALTTGFMDFRFNHNLSIARVEMGPAYHSLQLRSCVNVTVTDCYIHDMQEPSSANLRYGVWIANASHNVVVHGCRFRGVRHSITTGTNSGSNGNGIQRNVIISACVSEQSDTAHYDCHQPCDGVLFVGCTAIGGMVYEAETDQAVVGYQSRGRNVAFLNCQAMNIPGRGFMVQGAESDNTRIIGCTISNITGRLDGQEGVGIYVDTGGSFRHIISNNMIMDCNSAAINLGGGTGAHDTVITGNVIDTCGKVITTAAVKATNALRGVFANNRVMNSLTGAPFSLLGTASDWQVYGNSFNSNTPSNVPTLVGRNMVENNIGCNPDWVAARGNLTGAVTFDLALGSTHTCTMTGNITPTLTAGLAPGNKLRLVLKQDGTGSRTFAKPSNALLAGGSFTPTAAAGAVSALELEWDGTNWLEISRSLNLS